MAQNVKGNKPQTPEDIMKIEIAEELGLLERVKQNGWGSLTAKETGRIGGLITRKKQLQKMKASKDKKPSL